MRVIRLIIPTMFLLVAALSGCDKQRDLYVKAPSMLLIETHWQNASVNPDIWTATFYNGNKYSIALRDARDSISIHNGNYAALCVNGTLDAGIDYVRFRGTDKFETFEAHATTKIQNIIFGDAGGTIINHPDTLYGTSVYKEIAGDEGFYIKYLNGRNGFLVPTFHLGDTVRFTPERLTYKVTVVATLHAFQYAAKNTYVVGCQSGFASSVFVGTGMPSHQAIYHEFSFPRAATGITTYTQSVSYNSFGPPIDLASGSRAYSVRLRLMLRDGKTYDNNFDVTSQVEAIINRIKTTRIKEFTIYISDTLPQSEDSGLDIGVAPWEEEVRIPIPIKF